MFDIDVSDSPSPSTIRQEVDRIVSSPFFVSSPRLAALLRFVVDAALEGKSESLRESTIGDAVYAREPPYDPRIDSTVRVEARRLRRKLELFYAAAGPESTIRIVLPTGSYVPGFEPRQPAPTVDGIFARGPGTTIAIVPLRALSSSIEDEVFADGLTDELTFAIEQSSGLRLASRTTTVGAKNDAAELARIANELGIDAFIQGTVRRVDGILRITVETASARGFISHSDRFDLIDDGDLELQDKIAKTILARVRFDSSQMNAKRIKPTPQAVEAFGAVYRARRALDRQNATDVRRALAAFEEVARSAPDYARGYTGVADCYCDLYRLGAIGRSEAGTMASRAARSALEIDDQSAEAYTALATIAAWIERDYDRAAQHYQKAIELNDHARTYRLLGLMCAMQGQFDEAHLQLTRARAVEPISMQQDAFEAMVRFYGRCDVPNERTIRQYALTETAVEARAYSILSLVQAGHAAEAKPLVDALAKGPSPFVSRYAKAAHAAAAGDFAGARERLDAARAADEHELVWYPYDPRFDALRD